jgi:hypothetical protein
MSSHRKLLQALALLLLLFAIWYDGYSGRQAQIQKNAEQIEVNDKSRVVLCAQREQLRKEVEGTRAALAANPDATVIFGFPVTVIQAGLAKDSEALRAYDVLNC